MTFPSDDHYLAEQFAGLRREDREAVLPLAAFTSRPMPRPSRRTPLVRLAATIVATMTIGIIGIHHETRSHAARERQPVFDLGSVRWVGPTDFLLTVPGDWLLRDLPRIDAPASFPFDTIIYRRVSP